LLQDKQSRGPQQVEDTEDAYVESGKSVSRNPIIELQCRLETKLNALKNTEHFPALRKHFGMNKQND
jgi:hypothetical protein